MKPAARRRARHAVPDLGAQAFRLASGLELVVSSRAGAPVFAAQLHLRGGHSLDPAGREGTAYLTGGLTDQGTARHDEQEIAGLLEPAGGQVQGDASGLSGAVAGPRWRLLLDLLCELATEPRYPADRVALHRGRLLDRLRLEAEDPRTQAVWAFRRLVYGDLWLGRPEYGNLASVETLGPRQLRAFHRAHWVPERGLLAICGDVEPEAVRRHLARRLKHWKPGKPLGPRPWREPAARPRVAAFGADRQQVHVYLGHLGIRRSDPDYPALLVLDHILGTGPGFTSRITRRLRDELGLAYSVHAAISSSAGVFPGLFSAYIGTSPRHVATAIRGFVNEIRRIREEPVEDEELALARDYLLGSFALGFERAGRRAQHLIYARRNGLADDHLERLFDAIAAVGVEDVQRVAQAHLFPERACVAAAGPIGEAELESIVRRALARPRRQVRSKA